MTDFREALATALLGVHSWGRDTAGYEADDILAALPASIREAVDLGLAWQEAEAALPEGAVLESMSRLPNGGWEAEAWNTATDLPYARVTGRTGAAALRALAVKLREAA